MAEESPNSHEGTAAAVATAPSPRPRRRRLPAIFLLTAVAAGAAYWAGRDRLPWSSFAARDAVQSPAGQGAAVHREGVQAPSRPAAEADRAALAQPPSATPPEPDSPSGEERLQAIEAELAALKPRLGSLEARLDALEERLAALADARPHWKLAEVEYLLRLAQQRLWVEREVAGARALLREADQLLASLGDPRLFPVRRALAADLARLEGATAVDREALFLRLDALLRQVPELEFPTAPATAPPPATNPEAASPWDRLWASARGALAALAGIVRVERVDEELRLALTPSEQRLTRSALSLALEQAQLALLRGEQELYGAALERAVDMLVTRFADTERTRRMEAELRALLAEPVGAELPPLGEALRALQALRGEPAASRPALSATEEGGAAAPAEAPYGEGEGAP